MALKHLDYRSLDLWAKISLILTIIGSLNLGLMGLLGTNILTAILGIFLSRVLFIIIGIAAAYLCYYHYIHKPKDLAG